MCGIPHRRTDEEIWEFIEQHGFDENLEPKSAREIAADYVRCFPRNSESYWCVSDSFKGVAFRPYDRKKLADFIFPVPSEEKPLED